MPNDQMAQQAGLATGNGVIVDETLRTDDPDIFAAGDVARWRSNLYPEGIRVEHWTVANDSGEAAGKSMAGTPESYKGLPFVFSDIGDTTFDYIGYTTSWDRVVMRDLGGEKFDAAYIAGGRMVAAATVGDEDFVNAGGCAHRGQEGPFRGAGQAGRSQRQTRVARLVLRSAAGPASAARSRALDSMSSATMSPPSVSEAPDDLVSPQAGPAAWGWVNSIRDDFGRWARDVRP